MDAVKTSSPFDPGTLVRQFEVAASQQGFGVEKFGEAAGCDLIALTKRAPGRLPRIYVSAGIHGDEPAPPLALLQLLEEGFFDARAVWFLCPLLNPAGFLRASRENADGIDLNRDYRSTRSTEILAHIAWLQRQPNFDLGLCLHEDWEATGAYLYELNPKMRPSLAEAIISEVARSHPIDPAALIDGRPASAGIIRPDSDPVTRDLWPEAIYLRAHHTDLSYTFETPSGHPLEERISAQCLALKTAVATCRQHFRPA